MYLSIHVKVPDYAVDSLQTLKDRQFQTFRHLDLQNVLYNCKHDLDDRSHVGSSIARVTMWERSSPGC